MRNLIRTVPDIPTMDVDNTLYEIDKLDYYKHDKDKKRRRNEEQPVSVTSGNDQLFVDIIEKEMNNKRQKKNDIR